jgi:hypothetical protein
MEAFKAFLIRYPAMVFILFFANVGISLNAMRKENAFVSLMLSFFPLGILSIVFFWLRSQQFILSGQSISRKESPSRFWRWVFFMLVVHLGYTVCILYIFSA